MISFFEACRRAKEIDGLGKAAGKLVTFAQMIEGYREDVKEFGISAMAIKLLDETGYVEEIKDSDEDDAQERIENIEELMNRISSYEEQNPEGTLSGFLEEVALVSDVDNADQKIPRVYLMTVHSAKGLEFSRVYLCGMEEGVFPGNMSINSGHSEDIEEERRLAYVAITRAKDVLKISAAKSRRSWGETQYNAVSRFIKEIPEEYLSGDINRVRRESYELEERGYSRKGFDDDIPFGNGSEDNDFFGSILKARKQKKEQPGEEIPKAKPVLKLGSELAGGKPEYEVGDMVEHVKYGRGKVIEMEKGPKDYKVTVLFDEAGQKIMYAAFAKLKKI
jgi:DNA helicase-2/ATP-dependent DNA helicase PcrA